MGMNCYRDQLSFSCGEKYSYKNKVGAKHWTFNKSKTHKWKEKKKKEFSTRKKAWARIWKKVFIIGHYVFMTLHCSTFCLRFIFP